MLKNSMDLVLRSEVEKAALRWEQGAPSNIIAFELDWSEKLLDRVIRLCRGCEGEVLFPYRKPRTKVEKDVRQTPAAPRQAPVPPSNAAWKKALADTGVKPSTVKARRVASIHPHELQRMRTSSLPIRGGQLG